jgi:hypothetical protein
MKILRSMNRRAQSAFALIILSSTIGCESLMDVSNPGSVEAGDLDNPALATTILNGALGRFQCAYVNQILSAAMLSRELINSSNWAPIGPFARRTEGLETSTGGCPDGRTSNDMGAYTPLQQSRYLAENGAKLIEAFPDNSVPDKASMLAQLTAYAAYATQLLGEGWCVMAFDQGPAQTREQVFKRAEEGFTKAITLATTANNTNIRLMSLVGRARARLNQGNLAGAAADADLIPAGFVLNAEFSSVTGQRENRVYNFHNLNKFVTVNYFEYANLMLGTTRDTRVNVLNTGGLGQSGGIPLWAQQKYTSVTTPIPIASWREAQLIIAEARPAEAAAAITRLRASQNLPAYTPSGNGHLADVLEERRRQLFLEGGHRYNDMLRHKLPFLMGLDHQDRAMGEFTCLPLPEAEWQNNPNITGNPNPIRSR